MPDLLVKLYELPDAPPAPSGIVIRRALVPEMHAVVDWVGKQFSPQWASECEISFSRQPASCHLALRAGILCGFCCHGVLCPDFLGPLGVAEEWSRRGLGAALLIAGLSALRHQGYSYAIIGWAGPVAFFQKTVGAVIIENSDPGFHAGMTKAIPTNE